MALTKVDKVMVNPTVATVTGTETLTNKTLTAPIINSPTGLVKGDVGLGNVDNTSDAAKNAAVATLTNKTLTAPVISTISNTGIITLPTSTDTLVGRSTADILTNKDIDGGTASNSRRITLPKDTLANLSALTRKAGTLVFDTTSNKPYYDDGTNLSVIGSGSGGGVQNYITNGNADTNSTGWATYADAAGTRPVDGTGGSPVMTFVRSTAGTSLSNNGASFLISKDAVNRQGNGASFDFTIDPKDKAKVLQISMDYIVESGTFVAGATGVDSDLIVYIYDKTNALLIEPSSFKFLSNSSTISDRFNATFQTASNSTSYRLIFHQATTSAAAYVLRFNNIATSPSTYAYGTPITDWQTFTPTGAWSTNTTYTGKWRRVGDSMEVLSSLTTAGAPTAATLTVNLPSGFSIDTTKHSLAASAAVGYGQAIDSGTTGYSLQVEYSTSTSVIVLFQNNASGAQGAVNATAPFTFGSTDVVNITYRVPIVGWSSSVQMSDQTDTRIVSMTATNSNSTQSVTTLVTNINFLTTQKDTHGAWNGSQYTVPVPGDYYVGASVYATAATFTTAVYLNGTFNKNLGYNPTGVIAASSVVLVGLKTGDVISIRSIGNNTVAADVSQSISIFKISGPNQIAATESINLSYTSSAGGSIGTSDTLQSFATKVYDTHGAWNGNTFTAPAQGKYRLSANIITAAVSLSTSQFVYLTVYKNGGSLKRFAMTAGNGTSITYPVGGSTTVDLLAGETMSVYGLSNVATSQFASASLNFITIERVGN